VAAGTLILFADPKGRGLYIAPRAMIINSLKELQLLPQISITGGR